MERVLGITLDNVNPSSGATLGGLMVTLTGTGLSGTTGVTFGGIAATNVTVVSSTQVTAVTPAHAAGPVDVEITTPSGSATKTNGFIYLTAVIGQPYGGGIIACLNGGNNNLIAATVDNSTSVRWGGLGTQTFATSTTNGHQNTDTIVTRLGNNGGVAYAAQICANYVIDSQGNSTCQPGNQCFDDWFLPADNNNGLTGQLNCLYTNMALIGGLVANSYWSSTEQGTSGAYYQSFVTGASAFIGKNANARVRCVRNPTS